MKRKRKILIFSVTAFFLIFFCFLMRTDVRFSELSFGMNSEETEAAVRAKTDEALSEAWFSYYPKLRNDLDLRFSHGYFSYNENGLCEVCFSTNCISQSSAESLTQKLISKFNKIYGFSSEDWDTQNDGIQNYCRNAEGYSVYIRSMSGSEGSFVTVIISNSNYEVFKKYGKLPVIPQETG